MSEGGCLVVVGLELIAIGSNLILLGGALVPIGGLLIQISSSLIAVRIRLITLGQRLIIHPTHNLGRNRLVLLHAHRGLDAAGGILLHRLIGHSRSFSWRGNTVPNRRAPFAPPSESAPTSRLLSLNPPIVSAREGGVV